MFYLLSLSGPVTTAAPPTLKYGLLHVDMSQKLIGETGRTNRTLDE